jgi:hypothetical protein
MYVLCRVMHCQIPQLHQWGLDKALEKKRNPHICVRTQHIGGIQTGQGQGMRGDNDRRAIRREGLPVE